MTALKRMISFQMQQTVFIPAKESLLMHKKKKKHLPDVKMREFPK